MRYAVNPDELRQLAGGLTDVAAGLGPRPPGDRPSPAVLGSPGVARALDQVSTNWSQARRRVRGEVEHLARAVQVAAASYAVVDGSPFAGPRPAEPAVGAGR